MTNSAWFAVPGLVLAVLAPVVAGAQTELLAVEAQREAYKKAYNDGATPPAIRALCDTLHEDVSFRGQFMKGVWTGPRDQLIRRWTRGAIVDCNGTLGTSVGVRVIGTNKLALAPTDLRKIGDNTYLESGVFSMIATESAGQRYAVESWKYVLIWVKDLSGKWVLKHIDMDP